MLIKRHRQATTTPKIRAAIPASDEPARVFAERHGTTEPTVYKWKKRDSVTDQSHTPHRLNPPDACSRGDCSGVITQDASDISRDDLVTALLAVVREFLNPNFLRSPGSLPAASSRGEPACLEKSAAAAKTQRKSMSPAPSTAT